MRQCGNHFCCRTGERDISKLEKGEEVLAEDGKYYSVYELLRHEYQGELLAIFADDMEVAKLTPSQQIKVVKNLSGCILPRHDKAEYVDAIDIVKGDYLVPQ